jgi:hypothetical protein
VGVLTPHVSAGPEIEIPIMTSAQVDTVVSRILLSGPGSAASSPAPASLQDLRRVASRADTLPDADAHTARTHHRLGQPPLSDHTEAVFFGGTGFRAAGAVERLERRIDRLVLEANQVLLWSILAATRTTLDITGYGRLLRESLPTTGTGVSS